MDDYDVILDVLTKHKNELQKLINSNMEMDMFNVMDYIRLDHIAQINKCIELWKNEKSRSI